jgi:hypothetical protein
LYYVDECTNKLSGMIRLKAGTWKLRGIRRGFERGCPQFLGGGGRMYMILLK